MLFAFIEINPDTQAERVRELRELAEAPASIKMVGGKPLVRPVVVETPAFDPATQELGQMTETIEAARVVHAREVVARRQPPPPPTDDEQIENRMSDRVFGAAIREIFDRSQPGITNAQIRNAIKARM